MQKMLSHLRRCVDEYRMIQAGDRIAIGVSGGKDSLVLLRTLAELRRFYPVPFEVVAITLDMGYENADFSPIAKLCEEIGVEYIVKPTNIKEVVFDIRNEKNPCALCAKLRRGSLNDAAKENGCNKVALGHHFDDAVETFMLSLFYEGRLSCFLPVTYLDRTDLHVIRPMLYMTEREVINFANRQNLPICKSGCPVDKETKREDI
ncbi:MAG: tRNA 2-thiocytidine biosynthesis protein TtcA, partial [Clostridia bacterium]|nr:tRNA 2-thiocytidine biosynthesis protein TtcA [Clostridia bacterium]